MEPCLNCPRPANRRRGLCYSCYDKPEVRNKFAPIFKPAVDTDNMTEAELDAFVESRRAEPPKWWNKEALKECPVSVYATAPVRGLFPDPRRNW